MDKILHFIPVWIKFYISGMFFIGFGVFGMVNKRGGGRTTAYGERKKRWWSYRIRRKKKGERRKWWWSYCIRRKIKRWQNHRSKTFFKAQASHRQSI